MKKYDLLVFIGRFQPFHNGHRDVILEGLKVSDKILVLVGSANKPLTPRNPFTYEQRSKMILDEFPGGSVITAPLNDVEYNNVKWVEHTRNTVVDIALSHIDGNSVENTLTGINDINIGLLGHKKDGTSFYLELFPDWGSVDVKAERPLDATNIRKAIFDPDFDIQNADLDVPLSTSKLIMEYLNTDEYKRILGAFLYNESYKVEVNQYPRNEVTVDALVVQSGHVLVIERKYEPGKGLYALPGGFLNQDETTLDGCIRELREETRLKIPDKVLRGSIMKEKVFSDPHRSERARIITVAYYILLENNVKLPRVYGTDDAAKAFWMPLNKLKANNMFEDHYHIIQNLIGN